ncbi:MAG: FTR1 family protein [Sneathiella sp.]|nr:FTR1 family protein [Sneathiella sp.]
MFTQTFFIVWRESIEALLVVGVLHAWLVHHPAGRGAMRYLWGGVLAGLGGAVALFFGLVQFGAMLPPEDQDYFQAVLIMVAASLIVHMVFWMRHHGRTIKRHLEEQLTGHLHHGRLWGIFFLAQIAVMREGAETVIFLQGIFSASHGTGSDIAAGIAVAVAAAMLIYVILQLGGHYLSWRVFFFLTETTLLLLACALFVTGTGYLVSFGLLPYSDPLWDTSLLLDDMSRGGGIIANLTGYRAMPDGVTVAVWILYWCAIAIGYRVQTRRTGNAVQEVS